MWNFILGSNQVSCSYKKEATHTSQQEDWLVFLSSVNAELLNPIYFSENMIIMCNVPVPVYQTQKASRRYEGVRREYWRRRQDVDGGFYVLALLRFFMLNCT